MLLRVLRRSDEDDADSQTPLFERLLL